MHQLMSASQIREWEQYTMQHEPISSYDLMERAATAILHWILQRYPPSQHVTIFCGNGNNGGDGLAIARLLLQHNFLIQVFVTSGTKSIDNQKNYELLVAMNPYCIVENVQNFHLIEDTLIIDALFGNGLDRPLDGINKNLVESINQSKKVIISIDIPSGLSPDILLKDATIIHAHHTLCFQQYKRTFLFPESGQYTGHVDIIPIDLLPEFEKLVHSNEYIIDENRIKEIFVKRPNFSHKGNFGHSLIIAGSQQKMGACVLASKACLRSGTGLLTVVVPEGSEHIIQTSIPEAMTISYDAFESIHLKQFQSIGLGPGLGTSTKTKEMVARLLRSAKIPLVIDADALNIISENKSLLKEIPQNSVLTPHPKEFERLFGPSLHSMERYQLQKEAALEFKLNILCKGRYSCLCTPDGQSFFNTSGNPGMAKGGSGDVLTGMITALFAQYQDMQKAVQFGMYLHGIAGDLASQQVSEEAMLATDLIEQIGSGFKKLFYTF